MLVQQPRTVHVILRLTRQYSALVNVPFLLCGSALEQVFDALPHLTSYVTSIIHASSNPSFQEECCQILGVQDLEDVEGSIAESLEEIVAAMLMQNIKGRAMEAGLSSDE